MCVDEAGGTSAYDIVTLVVAIFGLGLALLSLGWQAATFALSGSRVKVTIQRGYIGGGNMLVGPAKAFTAAIQAQLAAQGLATSEILAVEVRNVGRMPVNVEKIDLVFDHGISLVPPHGIPGSPALPFRLEHGSSNTCLQMPRPPVPR
jgi:hypothetical protein